MVCVLVASCGGDTSQPEQSQDAVADRDGTLRLMQIAGPTTMDPLEGRSQSADYAWLTPVYDRLIEVLPDLTLAPMLATSWDVTDGSVTFHLREGVTFHDGTPFDAEAVKANVDRIQAVPDSMPAGLLTDVTAVEVVDEHTVRFDVAGNAQTLLLNLASYSELGMASPRAFDGLATDPVGTGLYRLETLAQDRAIFVRVADYWDDDLDATAPERLEILGAPDESARLNSLLTDQADITLLFSLSEQEMDQIPPDFQQVHFEGAQRAVALLVNPAREHLDDVDVRRAISLAIDRTAIESLFLPGICTASVQLAAEGAAGHDPDLGIDRDVDEAQSLLDAAGATGATFTVLVANDRQREAMATVLQSQLADVGITLEVRSVTGPQASTEWATGNYDFALFGTIGAVDPAPVYDFQWLGSGNPGPKSEELQAMHDRARNLELGSPERDGAYREISSFLADNPAPHIVMCNESQYAVAQPDVVDVAEQVFPQWHKVLDPRYLAIAG